MRSGDCLRPDCIHQRIDQRQRGGALPPKWLHAAAQPAAQQQVLTGASPIGALLDNPRTRPVMDRFMPNLASNPHLDMIRSWPLRRLASDPHARGLTMERLSEIEAALAEAQRR